MIKRDILFEIGTEEIPARFLSWVTGELDNIARAGLADLRLQYADVKVMVTPRRITLCISDLADRQKDFEETIKGPPKTTSLDANGGYTAAALGFAKSRGVEPADLRFIEIKGIEYLHAVIRISGRATSELLPNFMQNILKKIVFPKNMYWEEQGVRFARPVRWMVAMSDSAIIPVRFGKVVSGAESRGHRFMGAKSVQIPSAGEYEEIMEREFVIVDHERRKRMIREGISAIEQEIGGHVDDDPDLLEENAQLVEYPVPFLGSFESEFLDIPEEVLIATMKKNQRYFPVRDKYGYLLPYFIGVSNNKAADMSVVRDGNERVLRARLHDAAFFWKEDLDRSLESRLPQLDKIIYQEQLGSLRAKTERVRVLCAWLVKHLKENKIAEPVDRAALLAKTDLVTGMVFEFPEVQGVMGREYAKRGGEAPEVAEALFEQYLPRHSGDSIPSGKIGAVLGICERADTIVAIHKVGLSPTGSADPYGLRRASRGINEILWGLELDVDLNALLTRAAKELSAGREVPAAAAEFCRQRLHNQLRERGYAHGTTSLAVSSMGMRPLQALRMLQAFDKVSGEPWFEPLVLSAVRVANILNKVTKDELSAAASAAGSFTNDAERALNEALATQTKTAKRALKACDWAAVCEALSGLSEAISGFFDNVMVMDPDPAARASRLGLLIRCRELFDPIGDFSLLK